MPSHHSFAYKAVVKEALTGVTHSLMHNAEKQLLNFFEEESIGVQYDLKCGNCLCGRCALGSMKMSLHDEREYECFSEELIYDADGTETDPGHYWRANLPWVIPKEKLIMIKPAVERVMRSTLKRLSKTPDWRKVYEAQLNDLVKLGVSREVLQEEIGAHVNAGGSILSKPSPKSNPNSNLGLAGQHKWSLPPTDPT